MVHLIPRPAHLASPDSCPTSCESPGTSCRSQSVDESPADFPEGHKTPRQKSCQPASKRRAVKETQGPGRRDAVELTASCRADRGNEGPTPSDGTAGSAGGLSRDGVLNLHRARELTREHSTEGDKAKPEMLTACSSAAFVFHQVYICFPPTSSHVVHVPLKS